METRANYLLIGSFVLLATAAVVLFAVWISKVQFSQQNATYDVVFEGAVNGLSEGGEVRFNGIKVGEVMDLGLDKEDPNRVIARIRIDAATPVRRNSKATLGFLGITGMTFIQLNAGSPEQPMLPKTNSMSPPRIETEKTQLDKLFAGGEDLLTTSNETLGQVQVMFSDENVARMSRILSNIEDMTEFAKGDGDIIGKASEAITALNAAGEAMTQAAVAVDDAAVRFDANVQQMTGDTLYVLEEMKDVVESANRAIVTAESVVADELSPEAERVMAELAVTLQDVRILVRRLDGVVEELERDPREFVLGDVKPYE